MPGSRKSPKLDALARDLSPRDQAILQAVVESYIATAEPVGSSSVSQRPLAIHLQDKPSETVSSATVRNVMARLEDLGYLRSPHTSAGRVPTEKGMRFYLDGLMRRRTLSPRERARIELTWPSSEATPRWPNVSRGLAELATQVGVCLAPQAERAVFDHAEFVRATSHRLVAIFVTGSREGFGGSVQHRLLELDRDVTAPELERMNQYLREAFVGRSLETVRTRLIQELGAERARVDALYRQTLSLGVQVLPHASEAELFVDGTARCLMHPEFVSNVETMKQLLNTLDERTLLLQLLDQLARDELGPQVTLGSELGLPHSGGLALVTGPYVTATGERGIVGVLGPVRMDYARLVPLVEFSASTMSRRLAGAKRE